MGHRGKLVDGLDPPWLHLSTASTNLATGCDTWCWWLHHCAAAHQTGVLVHQIVPARAVWKVGVGEDHLSPFRCVTAHAGSSGASVTQKDRARLVPDSSFPNRQTS